MTEIFFPVNHFHTLSLETLAKTSLKNLKFQEINKLACLYLKKIKNENQLL